MEFIELSGYTIEEKKFIAVQYLLPKQIHAHGLNSDQVKVSGNDVIEKIITGYTREAGVRNLERQIAALCRHLAVSYSESLESDHLLYNGVVTVTRVCDILGVFNFLILA